jgi:hypothetical protein
VGLSVSTPISCIHAGLLGVFPISDHALPARTSAARAATRALKNYLTDPASAGDDAQPHRVRQQAPHHPHPIRRHLTGLAPQFAPRRGWRPAESLNDTRLAQPFTAHADGFLGGKWLSAGALASRSQSPSTSAHCDARRESYPKTLPGQQTASKHLKPASPERRDLNPRPSHGGGGAKREEL